MVAGAGNSYLIGKSAANETPAFVNSSDRDPTNVPEKLCLNDKLLSRLSSAAAAVTRSFLKSNDLFLPPSQYLRIESLVSSLPLAPSPSSTSASTWFNRFLTSAVEDDDPRWYICFGMSRPTFFHLLSILSSSDSPSLRSSSLAATIFRLAHNAPYKSLLLRFGFDSVADASRAFFTICKLINEKLGQLDDPKPDFSPRLLPNCCGVLGFGRFKVDGKLLGSKGSLIVQAIVDSSGRFADISAGWPSTMKPEAIFRQSKLFSVAESESESESRSFLDGAHCELGKGISVAPYILGDSRLPLLPWLMTPYDSSSLNEEEDSFETSRREFNNVVRSALSTAEIAFDKVRARWRILDRKWKPETIEFLPFVITTCCLLHNFLVNSGDYELPEECVNEDVAGEMRKDEEDEEEEEEETKSSEGEAFTESRRIRDAIAENLSRVSSTKMN